jgi:hypothetical protein
MARLFIPVLALVAIVGTGCRTEPRRVDSAAPLEQALERFQGRPGLAPGSAEETAAIARFRDFLSELTPESIEAKAPAVYAADAHFNDTLVIRDGNPAIVAYLLATARSAESVTAKVDDVTRAADGTYYFRWTMEVRMKRIAKGQVIRTPGITRVRFDAEGQVLVHQDYWDSGAGLWEHVPVLGRGIRGIRARL